MPLPGDVFDNDPDYLAVDAQRRAHIVAFLQTFTEPATSRQFFERKHIDHLGYVKRSELNGIMRFDLGYTCKQSDWMNEINVHFGWRWRQAAKPLLSNHREWRKPNGMKHLMDRMADWNARLARLQP